MASAYRDSDILARNKEAGIKKCFIVVGSEDASCPPEHQRLLYNALPGPKEFYIIPGSDHNYRREEDRIVLKEKLSAWLNDPTNTIALNVRRIPK